MIEKEDDDGVPRDRGWSWVVCIAALLVAFLFAGVAKSFGLFFVEYVIMFNASSSVVSAIVSVQAVVGCVTALFVLTIGQRCFSIRTYVMFGAVVLCVSYVINALAPDIYIVIVGSGLVFGFGTAFIYTPATVIVGQYFEKKRGLANGIFKAGAGLGSLVFPPFIRYIFDTYGVRGGLMLLAGVLLNIAPFGALLRPPSFYKKRRKKLDTNGYPKNGRANGLDQELTQSLLHDNKEKKTLSLTSAKLNHSKDRENNGNTFTNNSENDQPSYASSFCELNREENNGRKRIRTISTPADFVHSASIHGKNVTSNEFSGKLSKSEIALYSSIDNVNSVIGNVERNTENLTDNTVGCIQNLKSLRCSEVFSKIFDRKVLKNKLYHIYVPSSVLGMIGIGLVSTFLPPHARDIGIDSQKTAILVSIYGGADLTGRFIIAFLSDRKFIKRWLMLSMAMIITGIICQLLPLFTHFWSLSIFAAVNGMFAGWHFTLYPLVLTDFVGIQNLSSALGMLALFHGVGFLAATPLLGLLRDKTYSYLWSFHTMGACLIVAGFLLLLEPFVRKLQEKKAYSQNQETNIEF